MKIETQLAHRHAVLRLAGDFESYAVGDFLAAIAAVRAAGRELVVLNLRKVKFMNSTAIGSVLRARKELEAAGGALVVARSSAFVREVFEKLGLDGVIRFHDEEEDAVEDLLSRQPAGFEIPTGEDAALFFRFYDQRFADRLGGRGVGAGEILSLELDGLRFSWAARRWPGDRAAAEALFVPGTELDLKFRLPLYSRNSYYQTRARVVSAQSTEDGVTVHARFQGLDDEASRAVKQYVADMALVRQEIEQAKKEGD